LPRLPTDRYNADWNASPGSQEQDVRDRVGPVACAIVCAALAATLAGAGQNDNSSKEQEAKRPKLRLTVRPQVAIAPARVSLTAELQGGSDDFEEYYCPAIEWEWGDDTSSESTTDCQPYEAGKSQIKRRYTVQHVFRRAGTYKVYFHLKARDRILGSAAATLQVQPGLGAPDFP
jgi:hypothetical protein